MKTNTLKRNANAPSTAPAPASVAESDVELSSSLTIAEALNKIRLLEAEISRTVAVTNRKVQQLENLANFSAILNSSLETDDIRNKSLEASCALLQCETATLMLVDEKQKHLTFETALGASGASLKKELVHLPINDDSIAGHVALSGRSMLINDVAANPYHFKRADQTSHFVTRNMICVPVSAKGKVIGILQCLNKLLEVDQGKFTSDDVNLLEGLSYQVGIAIENATLYNKLRTTFLQTAEAMAGAIEAKDRYTGGHTKRVLHYSMAIAQYLDLTEAEREQLRLAAILHDIGKIGIDDKILKKQYALNDEEYEIMKRHPAIGNDILSQVDGLKEVCDAMRFHHERPDGKGYPYGLKGDEIPLSASVISVADTFDAMVSTRPYRKGLDPKIAYDEIVKYSGTQFDTRVVEAFKKSFESGTIRKKSY